MSDGVRRQEEARGWHRLSESQVEVEETATSLLETLQWWYGNTNFAPDTKEYEHDRRLRGQYE